MKWKKHRPSLVANIMPHEKDLRRIVTLSKISLFSFIHYLSFCEVLCGGVSSSWCLS